MDIIINQTQTNDTVHGLDWTSKLQLMRLKRLKYDKIAMNK